MASTERPVRADAARNRARVLDIAYQTFAAEGLSVPIDEIARRAGVGAGTVYRHFPTKDALFQAVIADRMHHMIDEGRALLKSEDPGQALFTFLRSMVLQWGAADRGLVEALAGIGIDVNKAVPLAEEEFLDMLAELLHAAQQAGTARTDVGVPEVKTLLVGCQAMQGYNADLADRVTEVALDGLRHDGLRRS
ncbi:TetR/AcrR family transcriptional regulator [Mycobacterium paragordonae]|uniref:TetR/AcrR family transcriptional regulator n=1 Tax=Mycobacterium paragordonae TaxID=1389713 RepID=A0A4R5X0C8_9MYCO|nr:MULTISPECIES: TetR/AcrR family transcriptional regulator [Mycobacterium]PJE20706.1 MAG: TetR/AcrR family transcriptional regulator [Mycobacterium sp.]MDP7737770.1 TetR/AcrR family transcriptional regulator [Mycobacterium paragordonae]OBJ80119.1 TetR family transcriptional regulator [Mycobacterium gordonae]OBK60424.1 TetR family transcriptional regulator [Mycobacterium gordonae]TDL02300.1 TetR/AcrR family transcriptional regulator [Mycobacterium paragordonae]